MHTRYIQSKRRESVLPSFSLQRSLALQRALQTSDATHDLPPYACTYMNTQYVCTVHTRLSPPARPSLTLARTHACLHASGGHVLTLYTHLETASILLLGTLGLSLSHMHPL